MKFCVNRLAPALGFNPQQDVQVLSPMRRGEAGILNLNTALRQVLNPNPPDTITRPDGSAWGVGDRLMQIKNDYEYGLMNGDQGTIREFRRDEARDVLGMVVDFDGQEVEIEPGDFGQLVLAYACTVHKSQGSEYPMVIICLHTGHFTLLVRNLLYTAVTRSRKVVVLIAHPQALSMAVGNNRVARRNTYLTERIDGPE